jgi:hypothetical protein
MAFINGGRKKVDPLRRDISLATAGRYFTGNR